MDVLDIDPFAPASRSVTVPDPDRDRLAARGRAALLSAPAGGPVLVVTDEELARAVLGDPRIVKDPAWAPADWDPAVAELEPTAAEQASLTTSDGPDHHVLRRAHAPLFTARRLRGDRDRITEIARDLLAAAAGSGDVVNLMDDLTTRLPLSVLLDLLGIPLTEVDRAADGCRRVLSGDFGGVAQIGEIAEAGLRAGANRCTELGDRLSESATRDDLRYHLFGMILAGQLTTDVALGDVLLAELWPDAERRDPAELVDQVLAEHPPQPFTLWRFTRTEVEIAGHRLPPRTPVLVDLTAIGRAGGSIAFGAGPHVCIGAQLARTELQCVVEVLRSDFPHAALAAEVDDLRRESPGGISGNRLAALPVRLRPAAAART